MSPNAASQAHHEVEQRRVRLVKPEKLDDLAQRPEANDPEELGLVAPNTTPTHHEDSQHEPQEH